MPNNGTVVEVKIVNYYLKLLIIASFSFFPIFLYKRLIAFSCKNAFLQRTEICYSKSNLISVDNPNSLTDFDVLNI